MKVLHAALMAGLVGLSTAAGEIDPLFVYFSSEVQANRFDPVEDPPVVLVLEEPLRKSLLEHWRKEAPVAEAAARMNGLLLEEAGDPQASELLTAREGDRIRLLWRAGRSEEAGQGWLVLTERDRMMELTTAMLPVVACGDRAEIERFRDFLLEGLAPAEVVNLCRAAGLPAGKQPSPELKAEWIRSFRYRSYAEIGTLPAPLRCELLFEGEKFTPEEFNEIRAFLKSKDFTTDERRGLLAACGNSGARGDVPAGLLLCDWMEAHPGEVAKTITDFVSSGDCSLAAACGLMGMLHLEHLRKAEPENRLAALACAIAFWQIGVSYEEVVIPWRESLDPSMPAPAGLPESGRLKMDLPAPGEAALHFGGSRLPVRFRETWFDEWKSAKPRGAPEAARMAAWLCLSGPFWEAWDGASVDKTMQRYLLECVAGNRVNSFSHQNRQRVLALHENLAGQPWLDELFLRVEVPRKEVQEAKTAALSRHGVMQLDLLRTLLANAIAVENPLRPRINMGESWKETGPPSVPLFQYRAIDWTRRSMYNNNMPLLGQEGANSLFPEDSSGLILSWLDRADRHRLSRRAARSLEPNLAAALAPGDTETLKDLRGKLQAWWEKDQDPDAGLMLLAYRRSQDRAPWPEWADLWSDVAATMEVHECRDYAMILSRGFSPQIQSEVLSAAGLAGDHSGNREWMDLQRSGTDKPPSAQRAAAARAHVLLGGEENPLLWDGEPYAPLAKDLESGVNDGLVTLEKMETSKADLALAYYRVSLPQNRRLVGANLAESGRVTPGFAAEWFPIYKHRKNLPGMQRCIDCLADRSPAKALEFLNDPDVISCLGTGAAAERAIRAMRIHDPGLEKSVSPVKGIVLKLAEAGNGEAAVLVAKAACRRGCELVPTLLPHLPAGPGRRELLAAWLAGRPAEVCGDVVHRSGSSFAGEQFPNLPAAEWREAAETLFWEKRWDTLAEKRLTPLLVALIKAGVTDRRTFVSFCGPDEERMRDLFEQASFLSSRDADFGTRLPGIASQFTREVPAGEQSK